MSPVVKSHIRAVNWIKNIQQMPGYKKRSAVVLNLTLKQQLLYIRPGWWQLPPPPFSQQELGAYAAALWLTNICDSS